MSESQQESSTTSGSAKEKVCRLVVQQCLSAKLRFDTDDQPVSIGQGILVFTCFLQGASSDHLDNIVKAVLNAKLCEDPNDSSSSSRESVLHHKLDVLVIPQATLGGKLKGKGVQYHGLVPKSSGEEFFKEFVVRLRNSVENIASSGQNGHVSCGVYGARQILSMETNGPFTHVFEF